MNRAPGFARRPARRAFTLVEVMISFLLFGAVLAAGYLLLQRTFFSLDRQRQSLDTLHEARSFLMQIERDLREMMAVKALDTVFRDNLFDEGNALFYSMDIDVPDRSNGLPTSVTWSYDGPRNYQDLPGTQKVIYRQEKGKIRQPILTKQLKELKIWGTDGTVFRTRGIDEGLDQYRQYLRPHYYHPNNSGANGLGDLAKVKGVEVQLIMNEMFDATGKPIKTRTFVTRIYPRILNSKYE